MTFEPERYEMLVLGSGEGGKYLAWHMAKAGHRTAVVERKLIGGSCPNTNCLPSKNETWSAKVADLVGHADRFGMVTGPTAVDMRKVLARKRQMVDGLIIMHLDNYKASGAELIMGAGRFIAPKTIEVSLNDGGTRVLTGERVVLNLGTHATIPENSWSRSGSAAHQCRGVGARSAARPPGRGRRRLCRPGVGAGLSPLRQ